MIEFGKNNLKIVVSLLQLQIYKSQNKSEINSLTEAQNRVHSIAMVHELLFQSDDFSSVDLSNYYKKLLQIIAGNMKVGEKEVNTKLNIEINNLNINRAIPLGLLINELAPNSFKNAFNGEKESGLITLNIKNMKIKYQFIIVIMAQGLIQALQTLNMALEQKSLNP